MTILTKNNGNPSDSTFLLLQSLSYHLSRKRKFQLILLLCFMLLSGVSELISLGAVVPFLTILSNPDIILEQPLAKLIISLTFVKSNNQLVILFALTFAIAAALAGIIRSSNVWLNGRLAAAIGSDLSTKAYARTINQPYIVHLNRKTSATMTTIILHINRSVVALSALLGLVTSSVVAAALTIGLLVINFKVCLAAVLLIGVIYCTISLPSREKLRSNSHKISNLAQKQMQSLQEGLGSIRDVILNNSQSYYLNLYNRTDKPQRILRAENSFIGVYPRFLLEAICSVSIALYGGYLVVQNGNAIEAITLLGALALGAQRLLPALQQMYGNWSTLRGYNSDLMEVLALLNQKTNYYQKVSDQKINFKNSISFSNISFRYGRDLPEVLSNVNLEIEFGERIGLVGPSGSGKSTAVDILMGLLQPTSGDLLIDGCPVYDSTNQQNIIHWRNSVAHVPQSIYLTDGSIAENIAFGVPREQIDMDRVIDVAKQAQLHTFVESTRLGYESFVGENGIKISGGQKQRIGIARALYKHAQVLIFDEATSALDVATEQSVMKSIENMSRDYTLIIVAHRLSTVEKCDKIYKIATGNLTLISSSSLL